VRSAVQAVPITPRAAIKRGIQIGVDAMSRGFYPWAARPDACRPYAPPHRSKAGIVINVGAHWATSLQMTPRNPNPPKGTRVHTGSRPSGEKAYTAADAAAWLRRLIGCFSAMEEHGSPRRFGTCLEMGVPLLVNHEPLIARWGICRQGRRGPPVRPIRYPVAGLAFPYGKSSAPTATAIRCCITTSRSWGSCGFRLLRG
jgi:hypothetical protein